MFNRLKNVFSGSSAAPAKADSGSKTTPEQGADPVSEWASAHGHSYSGKSEGKGFALSGVIQGRQWKLERGSASRDFILGEELRARGDLKVKDASVLVMNRHLKDALEERAYSMYTDTLQTTADPSLPEEMRWLAMYPEVGWEGPPAEFWDRYTVLAEERDDALAWIDPNLVNQLMSWPQPGPDAQVPFILMLLRGKSYLRMQYTPDNLATLDHAASIFTSACESAIATLSTDISI